MIHTLKSAIKVSALTASLAVSSGTVHSAAIFNFLNLTDFDGAGPGATMSELDSDSSTLVTLTSVDILFPVFSGTTAGPIRAATSLGIGTTDIASGSSGEAIGINNPTISDADWDTIGDGNESTDMNNNESWVISFNVDVVIDQIDMESMSSGDSLIVSIDDGVTADLTLPDGQSGDEYNSPFADLVISAGTLVTFTASGDDSTDIRLEELHVTAIPEPSSTALLGLGGLALMMHRRR